VQVSFLHTERPAGIGVQHTALHTLPITDAPA
jgi:hypothetical protein